MLKSREIGGGEGFGTSDGSQVGSNGTCGWVLVSENEYYCSSNKVTSLTKDLNSYRMELHGLLLLMAGALATMEQKQLRRNVVTEVWWWGTKEYVHRKEMGP